jgi:hypothetical protein
MAIKKFTEGSLRINAATMKEVVDGTITVTVNQADVTAVGNTWERVLELHKGWELSFTCNYDPADAAQALIRTASWSTNALTAIALYEDVSGNYAGSGALVTSFGVTKAVGSPDKLNVTLKGNGALTYA